LLHLVGCLNDYINDARSQKHKKYSLHLRLDVEP